MWTHGRADMTKIIVAFRNFVNAPNKTSLKIADYLPPMSVPSPLAQFPLTFRPHSAAQYANDSAPVT
jgi:hypothetical protein